MPGEPGIRLSGLMAAAYGGGIIVGSRALIRSAFMNARLAFLSFMSMAVITLTSLICALPFLKMHGSYSDLDRLMIMSLVAANIALMVFVARSLIRAIIGLDANTASASPNDPAAGTARNQPETMQSNATAARHRRIIGYSGWSPGVPGWHSSRMQFRDTRPLQSIRKRPGDMLSLLSICGGYALLRDRPWSRWGCLPVSLLSLTVVPVGTLTGGYNLWYFATVEKPWEINKYQS